MIKWLFLGFLSVSFGFGLYLYYHLGFYKPVFVERQTYPEMFLVSERYLGPYHKINFRLIEIELELKKLGVVCRKTFGHFLDNPETTDADRLRSDIGCAVEPSDFKHLQNQELSFQLVTVPSKQVIYASFEGSPAVGPFKVYPKARSYADQQRISTTEDVMELYTVQRNGEVTTEYLFFVDSLPTQD